MYATGLRFGLGTVDGFDQRFDPQLVGARERGLHQRAARDLQQQARARDRRVQRRRRRDGSASPARAARRISGIRRSTTRVSQETREYVPMVLAAAWLFMHPERYNLEFPKIAGAAGSITLARPASIAELTICLGQDGNAEDGWFRTLRNLNPQLDPQQAASRPAAKLAVPRAARNGLRARLRERTVADARGRPAFGGRAVAAAGEPRAHAGRSSRAATSCARATRCRRSRRKVGCSGVSEIAAANNLRASALCAQAGQDAARFRSARDARTRRRATVRRDEASLVRRADRSRDRQSAGASSRRLPVRPLAPHWLPRTSWLSSAAGIESFSARIARMTWRCSSCCSANCESLVS